MKKLLLALICAAVFFTSCGEKFYSVVIENRSSKNVTYTYNGYTDTLEPAKSKTYKVKAFTQPPIDISVSGAMNIKMEYDREEKFTFVDLTPLELNVANNLAAEITIEAGKYIDDGDSTELTIPPNGKKTAKIYTSNPAFTSESGYPVVFDWELVKAAEDTVEETDTIYLIIG